MTTYIRNKAFIDGKWRHTIKTFDVRNPFSGIIIGKAADCDAVVAGKAIDSARKAFETWKYKSPRDRADILRKWAELISSEKQAIGELITLENGKPIAQSLGEIDVSASYAQWCSEEGRRTYGLTIPSPHSSKRMITIKQPVGVVSIMTPWNYPAAMTVRKVCSAIAAGCTVVLKPSDETPFTALALAELANQAGLPPGVLNVIPTSRETVPVVGELLCTHQSVSAISFTGSTKTGKTVLKHAASTVKKVSLELGGLCAFLVFNSCDLDKAVNAIMSSKFKYSGQRCVSSNRILIQSEIHDKVVEALKKSIENDLILGDGMDPRTTLGPLINEARGRHVHDQVKDAIEKGAKLLTGGKIVGRNNLFEPTLIVDVKTTMKCFTEETFGPLLPVYKFQNEEEAIDIANSATSGLCGYIFSNDVGQIWRTAENLATGIVAINETSFSVPECPIGGVKESGLGRVGSNCGLDEFLETKYICWGV